MSGTKPLTRDEIGAAIARKAWKDEAFHREVLADPAKAYEKHLGQPLPPGLAIKVVEDTADTVHFIIPSKPPGPGELSDAELESVAGGFSPTVAVAMTLVAGGAVVTVASAAVNGKQKDGW